MSLKNAKVTADDADVGDEEQLTNIGCLPDELLLLILGFIEDGLTLLDAVPLVSKQWKRVSRDPRAWASVRVVIDPEVCRYSTEQEGQVPALMNSTRVLLHAPALHNLVVDCNCWRINLPFIRATRALTRVRDALTRSTATVRTICFNTICDASVEFLWRNQHHVKNLSLAMLEGPEESSTMSSIQRIFELLARLHELQHLEMHFTTFLPIGHLLRNISNLKNLTHLEIFMHQKSTFPQDAADDLSPARLPTLKLLSLDLQDITDAYPTPVYAELLRVLERDLQHLSFYNRKYEEDAKLPLVIVESIARCVMMRSLSISMLVDPAILRAMTHLKTLRLSHRRNWHLPIAEIRNATTAMQHCMMFPSGLQRLELRLEIGQEHYGTALRKLIIAAATAARNIKQLRLELFGPLWEPWGSRWVADCAFEVLQCIPHIKTLEIDPFFQTMVSALMKLQLFDLEELTLTCRMCNTFNLPNLSRVTLKEHFQNDNRQVKLKFSSESEW